MALVFCIPYQTYFQEQKIFNEPKNTYFICPTYWVVQNKPVGWYTVWFNTCGIFHQYFSLYYRPPESDRFYDVKVKSSVRFCETIKHLYFNQTFFFSTRRSVGFRECLVKRDLLWKCYEIKVSCISQ